MTQYQKMKLRIALSSRQSLTFSEAAIYADYAESYLYKLTSGNKVPYSKVNGGKIRFDRQKLDQWLLSNPIKTDLEKEIAAATYVTS